MTRSRVRNLGGVGVAVLAGAMAVSSVALACTSYVQQGFVVVPDTTNLTGLHGGLARGIGAVAGRDGLDVNAPAVVNISMYDSTQAMEAGLEAEANKFASYTPSLQTGPPVRIFTEHAPDPCAGATPVVGGSGSTSSPDGTFNFPFTLPSPGSYPRLVWFCASAGTAISGPFGPSTVESPSALATVSPASVAPFIIT